MYPTIPHMPRTLPRRAIYVPGRLPGTPRRCCGSGAARAPPTLLAAPLGHPSLQVLLVAAADRQSPRRDVPGHGRARGDVGSVAERHGSHELGVADDEDPPAELGRVLLLSVVVAG